MSLDNLPVAWGTAEVGILCDLINGRAFKPSEWSETGLPIIRIQNLNNTRSKFNYFAGSLDDKHKVKKGDLLFAWSGTPGTSFGAHLWYGEDAALNQHIFKIVINEAHIDKSFFRYALNHKLDELILSAQGGVGLRHITKGTFEKTILNYPPLAEQQEIVRQLDLMLAQVEQIKARLDAIPAILKKFRQSLLADAVSGKLTEEWREENLILELASETKDKWLDQRRKNFALQYPKKKFKEPLALDNKYMPWDHIPYGWELVSVSEFAECLDYLRVPIKKDNRNSSKGLYPYFGANGEVDRVDDYIIDDDLVLVTEDETFYGRTKPIAYRYSGKCWVNNHVHVLKAPTKQANDYLCFALMHYHVIPWLTGTTGRAKLSQAALNSLPLLMPPLSELSVIVDKVNELFKFSEQVEFLIEAAQKRVNLLTQSILAKAFSGELTAEWREQHQDLITGVNSAEALLVKIQAEREASKPVKKVKKVK